MKIFKYLGTFAFLAMLVTTQHPYKKLLVNKL